MLHRRERFSFSWNTEANTSEFEDSHKKMYHGTFQMYHGIFQMYHSIFQMYYCTFQMYHGTFEMHNSTLESKFDNLLFI